MVAVLCCLVVVTVALQKRTTFPGIVEDCNELYHRSTNSGNDSFFARDGFPKHIAALKPQVVQVRISEPRVVVEIKLRTGFWPKGLICVLDDGGIPFDPGIFHYKLSQVYSNIYKYSEGR